MRNLGTFGRTVLLEQNLAIAKSGASGHNLHASGMDKLLGGTRRENRVSELSDASWPATCNTCRGTPWDDRTVRAATRNCRADDGRAVGVGYVRLLNCAAKMEATCRCLRGAAPGHDCL